MSFVRMFFQGTRLKPTVLAATVALIAALVGGNLGAQTTDDGIMLSKLKYCTGVMYSYDYWNHYWEGSYNRTNGNIGTVTTRTVQYIGNYGVTDHLDILFNVPYAYTAASMGVLHGQSGFQDFTLSAKYRAISLPVGESGALRAIAVV